MEKAMVRQPYVNYTYNNSNPLAVHRMDEIWISLDNVIDDIQPYYMISNYGRVYSKLRQYIMKSRPIWNGYQIIKLQMKTTNSSGYYYKDFLIHRLVMIAFNTIDNYSNLQVNHIDGAKYINRESNLEWCNQVENNIHAYDTGLAVCGENHMWSVLTEDMVHCICKGLEDGLSYGDICEFMLNVPYTKQINACMSAIKSGKNWRRLSSLYNIPGTVPISSQRLLDGEGNAKFRERKFTDKQIDYICKCLEKSMGCREILNSMGYDTSDPKKSKSITEIVRRIRNRTKYVQISQNYNF